MTGRVEMALGLHCTHNKPKKAMQQAAQIIRSSCVQGCFSSTDCTPSNILKVIGWRVFGDFVTYCVV